jgi:hypothetical protein
MDPAGLGPNAAAQAGVVMVNSGRGVAAVEHGSTV